MINRDIDIDGFTRSSSPEERIASLINFGRLAPSSHNTQPWLFRVEDNHVDVLANVKRALPASDANHRQLFLSIGCAIENISLASEYYGLQYAASFFPDPKEKFFAARITFRNIQNPAAVNPRVAQLVHAVPRRTCDRHAYEATPLPSEFIEKTRALGTEGVKIDYIVEDSLRREAAKVVADATEAAFHDPGFRRELSLWIKSSRRSHRDGMPGYNIGVPWHMSFVVPHIIRIFDVAGQQRKMAEEALRDAPAYLVVSTRNDDPETWVRTGQLLERIWLMATAAGLREGPLAAAVQIGEFYRELQRLLDTSFRPQFFSRIGYCKKNPRPAPRLPLGEVVFRV